LPTSPASWLTSRVRLSERSSRLTGRCGYRLAPVSILGNRVLRTEDDRFLRGRGTYVENLALEGAASITFVRRCSPTRRSTGSTRARPRTPRCTVLTADDVDLARSAASIRLPSGHGPAGGGEGRRPLRRRDPRNRRQRTTARPVSTPPSWSWSTTTRCRWWSTRRRRSRTRRCSSRAPGRTSLARTQPPAANADDLFDGCDVTVLRHARQPADGAVPARATLDRRAVRGRQADRLAEHARPRTRTGRDRGMLGLERPRCA
jgi:hypothetical protein